MQSIPLVIEYLNEIQTQLKKLKLEAHQALMELYKCLYFAMEEHIINTQNKLEQCIKIKPSSNNKRLSINKKT